MKLCITTKRICHCIVLVEHIANNRLFFSITKTITATLAERRITVSAKFLKPALLRSIGFNFAVLEVSEKAFSRVPGVKAFRRSWEKALVYADEKGLNKWEEKVAAGLHVIDGLRCSFVVDTVEENLKIERRLKKHFPVVQTKNGHQRDNRSYADRKFNLVYTAVAKGAGIEVKKIGHLLYQYERSLP